MRDKNKSLILCPARIAEKIIPLPPEHRVLCAIGTFVADKCSTFWHPIQSGLITDACVDEANAIYHRLRKEFLRQARSMRRFCAANPDAQIDGCWCPTYDFVHVGAVNHYRLRCMINNGDFNFMFFVYQKTTETKKEAA